VEEDTVVESLIDIKESSVSRGVSRHGLDDGTVGGTSSVELGLVDHAGDWGESKEPIVVVSIEVELINEVQEGSVVAWDVKSAHELNVTLGLVNALEGKGKGSVKLFVLDSISTDSGVIGNGEGLG